MTERVTDLAPFLAREWTLERRLTMHDNGRVGTVTGSATWFSTGRCEDSFGELRYTERGTLRLDGHTCRVSRSYLYLLVSGTCAEVRFADDGRFFHLLDLRDGRAEVEHHCGDDGYRGEFEALSPVSFRQRWDVTGPAKDYTSITLLRATGEH